MNSKWIIQLAFLVIAATAINWYLMSTDQAEEQNELSANDPDLYMKFAKITRYDPVGQLLHQIQADRFTHYPLTDVTTLISPSLILYENENSHWRIQSRAGRILPVKSDLPQKIELWDTVVIEKVDETGRFLQIRSEDLTVTPEQQYAETDRRVIIDDQAGRTTASGMKAFLKPGKFSFYSNENQRVSTTIIPKARKG